MCAWPQPWQEPYPYYDLDVIAEDEDEDDEGVFTEVDIPRELDRVATDALAVIVNIIRKKEIWRKPLLSVINTFSTHLEKATLISDQDLMVQLASALTTVDAMVKGQKDDAVLSLMKELQRHAQDATVLACSKFIDHNVLFKKGVPKELLDRLELAFIRGALDNDDLWSRLGNSKYHLFTPGRKFGERKHRHGRGGRGNKYKEARQEVVEDADVEPTEPRVGLQLSAILEFGEAGASSKDLPMFVTSTMEKDISQTIDAKLEQLEEVLRNHGVYTERLLDDIKKAVW